MKIKCSYCRAYIDDTDVTCPYCGAFNEQLKRTANGVPQTISELQEWYKAHNLPKPEVTRFFIGENYEKPKAFGIYKEEGSGNFIVYKNKADGTRAIRYEGKDEAYAVNELYIKLKEEIVNQKQNNLKKPQKRKHISYNTYNNYYKHYKYFEYFVISMVLFIFIAFIINIVISINSPKRGYYTYDDNCYYYQDGSWYMYDDGWSITSPPTRLEDNFSDYYETNSYYSDGNIDYFEDSTYYKPPSSSSTSGSSSSSSSDWDSSS
ncbi:MAG: zinc ribbon domain-containing protein, partial [Clostridia bacterium]